ncbi:hypothetical protein [Wolbachia endosymbiont of Pentidionis agamae]|uniref:hypothetical protein n=1 Tax=Wolbachia endosymbiont of Pentidionis agamae TaxID=3110435 RepID=UPI002FCF3284
MHTINRNRNSDIHNSLSLWNNNARTIYQVSQRDQQFLSNETQKLFDAIYNGNLEDFRKALEEGADVNAFDNDGYTPLIAIIMGNDDIEI